MNNDFVFLCLKDASFAQYIAQIDEVTTQVDYLEQVANELDDYSKYLGKSSIIRFAFSFIDTRTENVGETGRKPAQKHDSSVFWRV